MLKFAVLANLLALYGVQAQNLVPLASKTFAYPNGIPYQVSGTDSGPRGPQSGYNICNSTTEGPNSNCQTMLMNSLDDFCMWSSNFKNGGDTVGDGEAREVAWCTKPGHGSRLIPPGALTGVQWLYAKNYIQVVGYIDQTKVGLKADDSGGELDPHGADEQGNPLGGLVYTNGFGLNSNSYDQQFKVNSTPSTKFEQVREWVDFIGSGMFCIKSCNPSYAKGNKLCNHIYDRIGCEYNAVADYGSINGKFEVCDSEDMTPPGVYEVGGTTMTWVQGPEGQPVVPPYTPVVPKSSNCHTYSSAELYGSAPATSSASATTTGTGATPTATGGNSPSGSGSRSGSGAPPAKTGAAVSLHGMQSPLALAATIAVLLMMA